MARMDAIDARDESHPRLKSCVEAFMDPGEGLILLREGHSTCLPHPIYSALGELLDGAHTLETILRTLYQSFPPMQAFAALSHLRDDGWLATEPASAPRPVSAFWEQIGVSPRLARTRLAASSVSVTAIGAVDHHPLGQLLTEYGLAPGIAGSLAVVVVDDYVRPELESWNTASLASGQNWMLVRPVGIETWLGPIFVPGRTACWSCLAQRLRGHRKLETYIARRSGEAAVAPASAIGSSIHASLAEAAMEVVRWIGTDGESPLLDRVVSTSLLTLERRHHVLTRRPQCPACGRIERCAGDSAAPMRLQRRPNVMGSDVDRCAVGRAALPAGLDRHVSPITGIVAALEPGARTSGIARTIEADHNFAYMEDDRYFLREGLRRRSGGKGSSIEQVRASAICESLERYSGVFDGTEPRTRASGTELGDAAIHPNACMGFSDRQYAMRDTMGQDRVRRVPEPFRVDVAIEWTPLWSLSTQRTRFLPTSFCYYGYRNDDPVFAIANSNGCAAGAVPEEAILHGFLELLERDAVAIWWYNQLRRPGVDLGSFTDPAIPALIQHYAALRRDLWALDLTCDFGVPVFAALSKRTDQLEEDIIYGFGAHLDPAVALLRAVTEVNQSLEAVPLADGPPTMRSHLGSEESRRWWRTVRIEDAAWLAPDPALPPRRARDLVTLASDDVCQDVETCLSLAGAQGIDVLVLDQTRPDVGLPVMRVVAPGLRHFWPRFAPGRLYDVPVRQGSVTRRLREDEMNPFAVQF
jgi:oxazoline/thiazoline synthase